MNTTELRLELMRLAAILEPVADEPRTTHDAAEVQRVWERLHGQDINVPWDKRLEPLHRLCPDVMAWCVIKIDTTRWSASRPNGADNPHLTIWPHQAYAKRPWAERWRDFLEDYYRDVHVRDGKVTWETRKMFAPVAYYNGTPRRIGAGYDSDRHGWAGTLPMEVFKYDRDKHEWRRKP